MPIEIYMPCEPEIVCDGINLLIALAAIVFCLLFIRVVWREYQSIKAHGRKKNISKNNDKTT